VEETPTESLFAYGTLQSEAVQLATFHRKLNGHPDALLGYSVVMIEILDPEFVASSGTAHHRNLHFTGITSDIVEGTALSLTKHELALADSYEPSGYYRTQVQLQSGATAWVYIHTDSP
jgi:gamma-glutamylcyclotransferase (GGCT)/AIG2-like uncharacterized protein YtfP